MTKVTGGVCDGIRMVKTIKIKNQLIFQKETWNNIIYTKNCIKNMVLPSKVIPININFDEKKQIGFAENFKKRDGKVYCDLEIDNSFLGFGVGIKNIQEPIKRGSKWYGHKVEIIGLSVVPMPLSKEWLIKKSD